MGSYSTELLKAFHILTKEAKELFVGNQIAELNYVPSSLEFHRNYVARNIPVIIRGGAKEWPAIKKWSDEYFRKCIGHKIVTVAVTPNGYADGLAFRQESEDCINTYTDYFVMPEEKQMEITDFLDELNKQSPNVMYIQRQNSNLTEDFAELMSDVPKHIKWASEAFDKRPDAINFWMGDERAITSMHKDPYENIYAVISGHKNFILIPPTDLQYVPRGTYPVGIFQKNNNKWEIIPQFENNEEKEEITVENEDNRCSKSRKAQVISWVSLDPLNPDLDKYPLYKNCSVFDIQLNAGDLLYLPSLWYHHVRQSHKCIAVNYWYDMDYDARYCYYKMVETLCGLNLNDY